MRKTKTGKERRRREQLGLYRVHYECVRRNPRYKEGYEKLNGSPWAPELARALLASEWGILRGDSLPDPYKRPRLSQALSRAIPEELGSPRFPGAFLPDRGADNAMEALTFGLTYKGVDRATVAGMLALVHFPEKAPEHPGLTVFDTRWSKKDLMETFERWVDDTMAERAAAGLKQERPHHRLRLNQYSDYLHVYDLRSEGKTFSEIDEMLWPASLGDGEKKARDYYKKGKALAVNPPLKPRKESRISS